MSAYYYQILVANKYASDSYIYFSQQKVEIGQIVAIDYGKHKHYGVCIGIENNLPDTAAFEIKEIKEIFDYKIGKPILDFAKFCADYNLVSIGAILEMIIPSIIKKHALPILYCMNDCVFSLDELTKYGLKPHKIAELKHENLSNIKHITSANYGLYTAHGIEFSEDQKKCIEEIQKLAGGQTCLLQGVTGSGKTLVALMGIYEILRSGKKVLIITPEVSLGRNWAFIIEHYFNQYAYFYNYQTSNKYKSSVFAWANSDDPGIIIGARSALFLPYKNLGAIIIDEEHSISLKQERYPRYHARDMALMRAKYENIPLILLSATPGLETLYNIQVGKYQHFKLTRTPIHGQAKFMFVKAHKNGSSQILAPEIVEKMNVAFENGQQVLIFLNRKGYSPYCLCNLCNSVLRCRGCDTAKIFYANHVVTCHKCGSSENLPVICPYCKKSTTWRFYGIGIEKLHEFVLEQFPNQQFAIVTSDTKEIDEYIELINTKKIDCLLATQVLAQGHDFRNISLAIIADADMGLNSPDFRASERMLQLWQQIRGRSARHEMPGQLIIQGAHEDSKFIQLFKMENPYEILMQERQAANWPPFSKCAFVIIKSKNYAQSKEYCNSIFWKNLKNEMRSNVFGPLYIGKHNFVHEWRFLIKLERSKRLDLVMHALIKKIPKMKQIKVEYEMDPYTFT